MEATSGGLSTDKRQIFSQIQVFFSQVPLLSWLLGALVAVALEYFIGNTFARTLGLRKAPMLFGFVLMLKKPMLIHSAIIYFVLIYLLPITVIARLSAASILTSAFAGLTTAPPNDPECRSLLLPRRWTSR